MLIKSGLNYVVFNLKLSYMSGFATGSHCLNVYCFYLTGGAWVYVQGSAVYVQQKATRPDVTHTCRTADSGMTLPGMREKNLICYFLSVIYIYSSF